MFTIHLHNKQKFEVPVIYKTDNLVLHRQHYHLNKNIKTKKRAYTITWFNDNNEVFKLIDIEHVNINKIKYACDIIQSSKYDLNSNAKILGKDSNFKQLCYDLRRELNVNKGDNL